MAELTENTKRIISVLQDLKDGEVVSYRDVANMAGIPRGARQVSRVLHGLSDEYKLPWWRVVRADGRIALLGNGRDEQIKRLNAEGVMINEQGKIQKIKK